jgi:hypothetical protein
MATVPPARDLRRERKLYWKLVCHHYLTAVMESINYKNSGKQQSPSETVKTLHQIQVDIPRTSTRGFETLFRHECLQEAMERLLLVWSFENPTVDYFQGLNDLVPPFFVVFLSDYFGVRPADLNSLPEELLASSKNGNMEADIYWCMSTLFSKLGPAYPERVADSLIPRMIYLLRLLNEPLYQHLAALEVDFLHFGFRWLVCLLVREFPLTGVITIWDDFFTQSLLPDPGIWCCYLGASLLDSLSAELLKLTSFEAVIIFLQKSPSSSYDGPRISQLLARAKALYFREQAVSKIVILIVLLAALVSLSFHIDADAGQTEPLRHASEPSSS